MLSDGCRGKIRHPSLEMATAHVADLKRRTHEHPKRLARLEPYPCQWCQGWHVGHYRTWKFQKES